MNSAEVPALLQPLLPIVQEWSAATSDSERYDVAAFAERHDSRIAELEAWAAEWTPETQRVYDSWSGKRNLTDSYEACKFYFLLLMLDELEIPLPKAQEKLGKVGRLIAQLGTFEGIAASPNRMFAAMFLSDFGPEAEEAISSLKAATEDPAPEVRAWAHAALASITGNEEEHRAAIREITPQAKGVARGYARDALASIEKSPNDRAISRLAGASITNDLDEIRSLIGKVDVNAKDHNDRTALQYAVGNGQLEAAELLLQAGADPNQRDRHGDQTLLHMSACRRRGHLMIELLLRHGADPKSRDAANRTPLDIAKEHGRARSVRNLVEKKD